MRNFHKMADPHNFMKNYRSLAGNKRKREDEDQDHEFQVNLNSSLVESTRFRKENHDVLKDVLKVIIGNDAILVDCVYQLCKGEFGKLFTFIELEGAFLFLFQNAKFNLIN